MGKTFQEIYKMVKQIPAGKVATYGQIAEKLKVDPRVVGWALHANKSTEIPCHRVVDRAGRLAPNFAFDGWQEQKRRLQFEGIEFKEEMKVDLIKCLWSLN